MGTHQSTSFYGGAPWQNYSAQLVSQRQDRIWSAAPTAFNAVVQEAVRARDMVAGAGAAAGAAGTGAAAVPVHPWFAPRDFVCQDPGMPTGGAGSHLFGSPMWQEMVFHVLLATGATELLWWKPGAMEPYDVGVDLLVATMRELQQLLNGDDDDGDDDDGTNCTTVEPIISPATAVSDWARDYVLSGARCGSRSVYRFTPRCINVPPNVFCVDGPPRGVNGSAATFKIGSGFSITPVPGARVVEPADPVAGSTGWWAVLDG